MNRRLSLSFISYFYIIFFVFITSVFTLSEIYKSIIAQPALFFFPYCIGLPLLFFVRKILKINENKDLLTEIFLVWSFGVISLMILEIFLYTNYLFYLDYFILILLFIGFFSVFIKRESKSRKFQTKDLILCVIIGICFSLFITLFWNYPYCNENDYIRHTFYALEIINENRPLIFDSMYLPTMHTLYALLFRLFNISTSSEPLLVMWSSRFILYPIYAIGIFIFSYQILKNRLISIIATIMGTCLVYSLENSLFPWHTAPKNFIALLFIFGLYTSLNIYEGDRDKKLNPVLLKLGVLFVLSFFLLYLTNPIGIIGYEIGFLLIFLFVIALILIKSSSSDLRNFFLTFFILLEVLLFFHKLNGFLGGIILLGFIFILFNSKNMSVRSFKILSLTSILFTSSVILLFYFDIITYPSIPLIKISSINPGYLFGWDTVLDVIRDIYPIFLLILFGSSCIFILLEKRKELLSTLTITSLLILMCFFPIMCSYRFLIYAHPFIILLSAYGFFRIVKIHNKKVFSFLLLYLLSLNLFIGIYTHDVQELGEAEVINLQKDYCTFEVGTYLKDNAQEDSIIICYEWYQKISANYGLKQPIFLWRDGRYQEDIIKKIYLAKSSKEAYDSILKLLNDGNYIVPITDHDKKEVTRFYKKPSEVFILYDDVLSRKLKDRDSINKFLDSEYFTVSYVIENVHGDKFYVFKLKM